MWADWLNTTIGEQVRLQRGIDITKAEQRAGRVPVVSSGGISSYHDTAHAKAPGVVLGRKGNVGTVFYLAEDYWPHDTSLWVTDFHGNDPRFVYYFFLNFADELKTMDVGSANPALNRNHVHPLKTTWPQKPEQRAITRVLGALDDKIELNRRMNRTLEELAAALFRSWFVDFDPVVAKAAGRKPAHLRPELAALFPAHWQDSPLGPIPHGWRVASVGDKVNLTKGVSYRSSELAESAVALVTLKSIRRGGGYRSDGLKPFTGKFSPDQIVEPGELIVSQTDVTQAAELVGRAALVNADSRFKTLVASLDILIVRPRSAELGRSFFYTLFGTFDYVSHVVGHANGTTVLHLDKSAVPTFQFACPTPAVAEAFQRIVEPWYQQIANNERESRTLAALRDTLLPKLLSGELRVKQAEKLVEGHT